MATPLLFRARNLSYPYNNYSQNEYSTHGSFYYILQHPSYLRDNQIQHNANNSVIYRTLLFNICMIQRIFLVTDRIAQW